MGKTTPSEKRTIGRFKWVIGIPYFVQGSSYLTEIPILYFIKNVLSMGDAGGQLFDSLRSIGWFVKPLWGYISDRIPLFRYRRKSWYILMACLALVFWTLSAILSLIGIQVPLVYLFVFNLAFATYAFVDVVCDALMVEKGRQHHTVGSLINFQWMVLSLANAGAIYFGGWLQEQIQAGHMGYWIVFMAAGVPPLATAFVGWQFIDEKPVPPQDPQQPFQPRWVRVRELVTALPAKFAHFHRNNRLIWLLVLFIFFWKFTPSVGFIERSYLIDVRHFEPSSFGTILSIGGITFFFSILVYRWVVNRYQHVKWHHYLYAMVGLGILSFPLSFFLYLHPDHPWWNLFDGLRHWPDFLNPFPDWNRYEWFRLVTETILGFATIPAFIIPLTLAGETVKLQSAGMGYAFLMAFSNVTTLFEGVVGAGLFKLFSQPGMEWLLTAFHGSGMDIAGVSDSRTLILQLFVYISLTFTLLTIPFIVLLKREIERQNIDIHLGSHETRHS